MQPFDEAVFDKRYADVFEPAIQEAGLEPYRVDRDPGVSIPIQDIEDGIRTAELCFAEITTDNPNVWFELGYAIAVGKTSYWCALINAIHDSPSMSSIAASSHIRRSLVAISLN